MSKKSNIQAELDELEQIVAWFEGDDIDIEEATQKFESGIAKAEQIHKTLSELENKITVLKERFDSPS